MNIQLAKNIAPDQTLHTLVSSGATLFTYVHKNSISGLYGLSFYIGIVYCGSVRDIVWLSFYKGLCCGYHYHANMSV